METQELMIPKWTHQVKVFNDAIKSLEAIKVIADKFDGISVSGPTKVCEYLGGKFSTKEFTPEQFGFSASKPAELIVGSPENNASLMHAVFTGEEKGAARTAVLLNAAAALRIARGISMEEGIQLAAGTIDSGAVEKKLNDFVRLSNGE